MVDPIQKKSNNITDKEREQVMVIRSSLLTNHGIKDGFHTPYRMGSWSDLIKIFSDDNVEYIDKETHEHDETFRAVIAYTVLVHDGWFWSYSRDAGSDPRLVDRRSIGVGGHIQFLDGQPNFVLKLGNSLEAVLRGARREIHEEIDVRPNANDIHLEYFGLINDTSDPVGRTHVGIVFVSRVAKAGEFPVRPGSNLAKGRWVSPSYLNDYVDLYEGWSKLLILQSQLRCIN